MPLLLLVLLVALMSVNAALASPPNGTAVTYVFWNPVLPLATSMRYGTGQPLPGEVVAVSVGYNDLGMDAVGWDGLYLEANRDAAMPAGTEFYAMGYAEGAVSQQRIYQYYVNSVQPYLSGVGPAPTNWINDQISYMRRQSASNPHLPFWQYVGNVLSQLDGLYAGYATSAATAETMTFFQVYSVSFIFELWDVVAHSNATQWFESNPYFIPLEHESRKMALEGHCSALIKVTPTDLFMAHDTWSSYNFMLRQYKVYNFTHRTVSMSSYPGTLHSGDDWYILSNGLTVQETTNANSNPASFASVIPTSVAEFIRVMVANHLAANGSAWVQNFCTENSGTYNNQFMIVNMNLFTPGQPLLNDTLWVVEQMPNMCESADVTDVLRTQGYWASYNIPYFPKIYIWSGTLMLEEEYGDYFSYTKYARPEIFKRDQGAITDIEGMKRIMRYNNYQVDPLSLIPNCTGTPDGKCNPPFSASLAIAKRGDLNPKVGDYGPLGRFVGQSPSGAIDCKIVSWSTVKEERGLIIAGPTYDQVSPFQWSTSPFAAMTHVGIPDLMQFSWTETTEVWTTTQPYTTPPTPAPGKRSEFLDGFPMWAFAVIVGGVVALVGGIIVLVRRHRSSARHGIDRSEYTHLDDDLSPTKFRHYRA